jgi:ribosome-associated toxin RatA of RatAB toxin-antitoxin module
MGLTVADIVVGGTSLSETCLMREMKRSALVARSPELVYRLVEDIERYPQFVPGCTEARILERGDGEVVARLAVRRGPLRTAFTTRNRLDPGRRVRMDLVEGPFSMLEGEWTFTPVADNGCRIELSMRFQFSNVLKAALFEPLFEETAASLVRAFVIRAQQRQ